MATYKRRLKNRNGDTIIPDIGLDLQNAVFSDEPTTSLNPVPWLDTEDIVDGAVTDAKTNLSLGETHHLTLVTALPVTAYNGTNYILREANGSFSGGTYLLLMSSALMYVSTTNYQAHINFRIDGTTEVQLKSWAGWGDFNKGTIALCEPVAIEQGTTTVEVGFGTNDASKQLQVVAYQTLDAWLVKVGD